MITIYKTDTKTGELEKRERLSKGSWISLVNPTNEELDYIKEKFGIDRHMITGCLHNKGLPRVGTEDDIKIFIVDIPFIRGSEKALNIHNVPLGILKVSEDYLITICSYDLSFFQTFIKNTKLDTMKHSRFIIELLSQDVRLYQKYIDMIGEKIERSEDRMLKATKNEDLVGLLNLEKSLVYISKAINSNALVLDKIISGTVINLYEEDQDILTDAILENNQAKSSSSLYRDILNSMTTTVATIISNNLNRIMKFLAGITIVLSIPTMVASFVGMNVPLGFFEKNPFAFPFFIVISLVLSLIVAFILKKKDLL